jgi:hypothetical protein
MMADVNRKRLGSVDYSCSVLLVSSSIELASELRDVINGTRSSVNDLPCETTVKAIILDSAAANEG